MDAIKITGARSHNLKNLTLSLPKNKLVVVTGLSGSGKSTLAFDTIYAEGSAATSSRCPPTRGSSWSRWTNPTWSPSRAFPPP
ncbi:MAG TPA: hypothetical protein PKK31_08270 [Elusimicrobiales bacterium]|nr:hypothetical protein [Elusimicrobiales bacterium]